MARFSFFDGMKSSKKICENWGFPIIFIIFYENYFEGISYTVENCYFPLCWKCINPGSTIEIIFIKNDKNDQKTHISHFHKKISTVFHTIKKENLANFSILNPESLSLSLTIYDHNTA